MKILNRPMFRMGGPIKEGIMNNIKEPRQRYAKAGDVFKQIAEGYQTGANEPLRINQQPRADVLQGAAELGIANPYKDNNYTNSSLFPKLIVPRKDNNISEVDQLASEVEQIDPSEGLTELQKAKIGKTFIGTDEYRQKVKELEALEKAKNFKSNADGTVTTSGKSPFAYTLDNVIKDKGKMDVTENTPLTKKERTNNILEMLGYDKAKKNALYDAMINAGQRISRTGLGADNLVSDVIADTSRSYDKPEKLREAANLMDVQQQLKLDQISASKTGGATKQSYDFFIEQGYSKEVAERKARNLPTTISEYFTASKASTDTGKLYDATRAATEEGVFGNVEYKGKIDSTKHKKLSEFLSSEELKSKGDGVYNILGEAVIIVDGQVKSRQVIQPKVDKKGWFD